MRSYLPWIVVIGMIHALFFVVTVKLLGSSSFDMSVLLSVSTTLAASVLMWFGPNEEGNQDRGRAFGFLVLVMGTFGLHYDSLFGLPIVLAFASVISLWFALRERFLSEPGHRRQVVAFTCALMAAGAPVRMLSRVESANLISVVLVTGVFAALAWLFFRLSEMHYVLRVPAR